MSIPSAKTPVTLPPNATPFFRKRETFTLTQSSDRANKLAKDPEAPIGVLMIGDVVGRPGRAMLARVLPGLRAELGVDLVVANTENLAHGFGITPQTIAEIMSAGVDVCTGGNHTWKNAAGVQWLAAEEPWMVLKPANILQGDDLPPRPGADHAIVQIPGFRKPIIIMSLLGEVFMKDAVYSPFATFDALYDVYGSDAVYITDLHAEATGEKRIFGWHVDGRVDIAVGTHTHTPTADEQIMPGGTAFMSDLGFTGARDSSLGMRRDLVHKKVVLKQDVSLEPPESAHEGIFTGLFVQLERESGRVLNIERLEKTALL